MYVQWPRSSETDQMKYKELLKEHLNSINVPREALGCPHFQCTEHMDSIHSYYEEALTDALTSAARVSLPFPRKKVKVRWKEQLSPHHEKAIFWNRMWTMMGKPRNGWVKDIREKTSREYKRGSRWVVRNQGKLSAAKMAQALGLKQMVGACRSKLHQRQVLCSLKFSRLIWRRP